MNWVQFVHFSHLVQLMHTGEKVLEGHFERLLKGSWVRDVFAGEGESWMDVVTES